MCQLSHKVIWILVEFEVCVRTCMCTGVSVCDTHKHASFTFDGSFSTFRLDLVTVQAHSLQGFAVLTHCRYGKVAGSIICIHSEAFVL